MEMSLQTQAEQRWERLAALTHQVIDELLARCEEVQPASVADLVLTSFDDLPSGAEATYRDLIEEEARSYLLRARR